MSNSSPETFTSLQELIWPEQSLSADRRLYVRLTGEAGFDETLGQVAFSAGDTLGFDTYFNQFNLAKWVKHCDLSDLSLALWGDGQVELSIEALWHKAAPVTLFQGPVALSEGALARIDVTGPLADTLRGAPAVLVFRISAQSGGYLSNAAWQTRQAPRRQPDLALSITTFRREQAVQASVRRFEDFMTRSPLAAHLHLIVVDNGQSAGIEASDHVTPIANENLGGSGGFARGLLAARERGASHCLFMDDDAAIHMPSLERTWMFLAYATDPATAVSGALASAAQRHTIWESGAYFDKRCWPLFINTDMRRADHLLQMEAESTEAPPHGYYGGWWYFAFPVDHARHMPFPFFVRGDDISFSLVHDFNIVTLPGVLSFQDADFADKESAQTLYLDLRSHLAHHLALPDMEIGRLLCLRIVLWFYLRSLVKMHYETLAALNLSFEDLIRGPEFFAKHADMSQRRADIKALMKDEVWVPADQRATPQQTRFNPNSRLPRLLMKLTVNGHLLPFFGAFGNRITINAEGRSHIRKVWGAAEITFVDTEGENAYTVRHSKRAAARQTWRLLGNALRFLTGYGRIRQSWRDGYDALTTEAFWKDILKLENRD